MWPSARVPLLDAAVVPYDVVRQLTTLSAIVLGIVTTRRQGIPLRVTLGIALVCAPVGVWGSRLLDMVEYAAGQSFDALVARNGSSIYGGLLGSFAVIVVATRIAGVPLARFLDGCAPAIALGESLSRLGCFAAGCCYGVPWDGPWAVRFPAGSMAYADHLAAGWIGPEAAFSLPVHPVQLYGFGAMLAFTCWLVWRLGRPRRDGDVFWTFLVGYGVYRLALGAFRAEALRSMQAFSVLFVVVGLAGLVRRRGAAAIADVAVATHAP